VELLVPPDAAGQRLDRYLAEHIGSRAQAARWIGLGAVILDGAPAQKSHILLGGERIELEAPVPAQELVEEGLPPTAILYEDYDLLIVDKPAGVVVHPAAGHRSGTVAQALAARGAAGGEPWRPGIVHRLDKDTSGLLVVAKSEAAHRVLKTSLAERRIVREYLALVAGRPPARGGTIDAPIGRDRRARKRMSLDSENLREARTHFSLVEALPRASLLRVRLETGRTHQIRAHFEAIGHPVCGDPQYGHAPSFGLTRQFLHAAHLELPQPSSGEALAFDSPLPGDLQQALDRARER
jgi:23S rRNA pseudouridine1911/1915/1917 synthase